MLVNTSIRVGYTYLRSIRVGYTFFRTELPADRSRRTDQAYSEFL